VGKGKYEIIFNYSYGFRLNLHLVTVMHPDICVCVILMIHNAD